MPPASRRAAARELAAAGLLAGAPPMDPGARLAEVLGCWGAPGGAFAHFLGAATDRLPLRDRAPLLALPPQLEPLSAGASGLRDGGALAGIDSAPALLTFHYQDHRARLADGTPARVRIRRPTGVLPKEVVEALEAVLAVRCSGWRLEGAVTEFRRWWETPPDLDHQSRALTRLAEMGEAAGEGPERPVAARPVPELCTASRLTVALPDAFEEGMEPAAEETSYRLFRGWLLLALVEGLLWTGPWPGSVHRLVSGEGGLRSGAPLWTGGAALLLDRRSRWILRDYLGATQRGDADPALDHLLQGVVRPPEGRGRRTLRDRFRQAVPPVEAPGSALASLILQHAHLLAIHGAEPAPWLGAWFRSLEALDRWAPPAGAGVGDPLAEAVEDARVLGTAARVREVLAPSALADSWRRHGSRWLDTLEGAGGGAWGTSDDSGDLGGSGAPGDVVEPAGQARRGRTAWIGFSALVVLLFLVALVAHRLGASQPAAVPVLALLFAGLALFTLIFILRA